MRLRPIMIFLFALSAGQAQADDLPARGQALLESNCGGCHAIGTEGDSPFAPAPPFRTLGERYPVSDLEESLAEGILTGHPAMPELAFEPDEIEEIIAYLESIQPK